MPQPYGFCYRIATFFHISILLSIIFYTFARGNQIDKNMKRILLSLCVLLSYTFSLQAQVTNLEETQEDSVINVIAISAKAIP